MDDLKAIAQQLIDAVQASSEASLKSLDATKRNTFADINNANNARGSLYSTQGGRQRTRWIGSTYMPAQAKLRQQPVLAKFNTLSQIQDSQRKIDSLTRAAAELNGIVFDY